MHGQGLGSRFAGACENPRVKEKAYAFRLSGRGGAVRVVYGINSDPAHGGYELLGLDFPSAVATGFPVLRADVTYEGTATRQRSAGYRWSGCAQGESTSRACWLMLLRS